MEYCFVLCYWGLFSNDIRGKREGEEFSNILLLYYFAKMVLLLTNGGLASLVLM